MLDVMSRGYSKIYNRKVNNAQTSIQFDKLFHENSKMPSAAKSAGTVGKWGVISCTSLRSTTGFNGRRDDAGPVNSKRMRADYGGRKSTVSKGDPFSFDTEPDAMKKKLLLESAALPITIVKPKKFFKSRNVDVTPPEELRLNASVYMGSNRSSESSFGSQGGRKYSKGSYGSKNSLSNQPTVGSKKFFTSSVIKNSTLRVESVGEQTEAMNLSSPIKISPPAREENKPPIVLRIFKGTAQLLNEIKESSASQQQIMKSTSDNSGVVVRSSRRRNHSTVGSDSRCSGDSAGSKDTFHSSIILSPKKPQKEVQREEPVAFSHGNAEVVEAIDISAPKSASGYHGSVESDIKEQNQFLQEPTLTEYKININCDNSLVTDSTNSVSIDNLHSEPCGSTLVTETLSSPVNIEGTPEELPVNEPLINSIQVDNDDQEKLVKAQELLTDTYVDFTSVTEKLLLPISIPVPSPQPASSKDVVGHDWFSDSEDSNSIADQINTIASSQGEPDLYTQSLKVEDSQEVKDEGEPVLETKLGTLPEQESEGANISIVGRTSSPLPKKGSIFKSRSLLSDGSKKRLALYKHKWCDDKDVSGASSSNQGSSATGDLASSQPEATNAYDIDEFEPPTLTRVPTWPIANSDLVDNQEAIISVKCTKKAKGFYTVVRNVKKAHQIQESGEFQEFNDDVEYILDALQDSYPIGTRCLSAITLASKCMAPAFRMHVRAHGTVAKFFRALHDATKDQSLGLCTATVMFVLSQDRLNMDLDRHSLELMLNLLESDASHRNALDDCGMSSSQLHKNKQKVRELCAEIQSQGHAKHLNLDNITVGHLAMETLLSLTSRRAGEWFKEELRELGGLEHIVKTICECCRQVDDYVVEWTEPLLDKLRKVDRCLRVLENVTNQNEENQIYLLKYDNGVLVDTLVKLYHQCDSEIPLYPVTNSADKETVGVVIREVLLATLKVLINLTHDFNNQSYGSTLAGEKPGIVDASLHLLLQVPNYVPQEKKFDLLVLALILLINLVEHSNANRKLLFNARAPADPESMFQSNDKTAVEALITLFYQQEELARAEEVKTDAILDGKKDTEQPEEETTTPKTQEEFIEETVAKLLQKAGRNMEHTLIGAYVGLLLGYLIMDNKEFEMYVRLCLPEKNFEVMVSVLQKVYNFMNLTASAVGSSRGIAQTERVIKYLAQSDTLARNALEGNLDKSEPMDLDVTIGNITDEHGDS